MAAASILARERFIDWLENAGRQHGITLPRGASAQVKAVARATGRRGAFRGEILRTARKNALPHRPRNRAGGVRPAWTWQTKRRARLGFVINWQRQVSCVIEASAWITFCILSYSQTGCHAGIIFCKASVVF